MKAVVKNQTVKVSALAPHSQNYNKHSDSQLADLRASLRAFGQVRSVVVQKAKANGHYTIVAGEGLTTAAKQEGLKELRADVIPASWSKTKVLAYLAADNELARHGTPDQAQLAAIVRDVMSAEGEVLARLAAGEQLALDTLLASQDISGVEFKEYGEDAANDVKYADCPKCGHKFPL